MYLILYKTKKRRDSMKVRAVMESWELKDALRDLDVDPADPWDCKVIKVTAFEDVSERYELED